MDYKDKMFRISLLISKYLSGEMTMEEGKELEAWKCESSHHNALFQQWCSEEMKRYKTALYAHCNTEEAFELFIREKQIWKRWQNVRLIRKWAACVAILILPIGLTFLYLYRQSVESPLWEVVGENPVVKNRPVLTLSDGSVMALDDSGFHIFEKNGVAIEAGQGTMVYDQGLLDADTLIYNTLDVPLYGDFKLTLSDGTKVHLNAGSSLRFPVSFGKNNRTVYASGEVYLEVEKDSSKPFFVVLNDLKVEVVGTRFNVNSYDDENFVEVTLAQGRVAVYVNECRYDLKPEQQFSFDKTVKQMRVRDVNPVDYISWVDGEYIFKGKTFKEVARVLERWYDIKINFTKSDCASMIYTGVIQKDQTIAELISLFEKSSGIKCDICGKDVFIR